MYKEIKNILKKINKDHPKIAKLTEKEQIEYEQLKKHSLNWDNYFTINNISDTSQSPIIHYIKNWREELPIIENYFETGFYLELYPDVKDTEDNPLIHYLIFGQEEQRVSIQSKYNTTLKDEEKHAYYIISNASLNWDEYFTYNNILDKNQDPIMHYIKNWKRTYPIIPSFFDTKYYLSLYKDIKISGINPLLQYLEHGMKEGREALKTIEKNFESNSHSFKLQDINEEFLDEKQLIEYRILKNANLKWQDYYHNNNIKLIDIDPIIHFIKNYKDLQPYIKSFFDTKLYFKLYPDIELSNLNPLVHYIQHGKEEGRLAWINFEEHITKGKIEYNKTLNTLIIVSHESSATGAPLVSINLAKTLTEKYNIINFVIKKSHLHNDFIDSCVEMIQNLNNEVIIEIILKKILKKYSNIFMLCNSVETYNVLKIASELNIPTLSLIHEFSDYTRPLGKISRTIFYADQVIVPAKIIKDSILSELKETCSIENHPNNIEIIPQGKLPMIPEGYGENYSIEKLYSILNVNNKNTERIVIGAGFVQIRKGVDLFISMAKQIKDSYKGTCKFLWIGTGYEPENDLQYSIWIKKQIEASNLEQDIYFIGHQKNLDNVLAIADIFALTSRLDPFPNVVIDALESNVHVACFQDSTGCAEFMTEHNADCSIVDYLDTHMLAKSVIKQLNKPRKKLSINENIVKNELNFTKYSEEIIVLLNKIENVNKRNELITEEILNNNLFDEKFYAESLDRRIACKSYVSLANKGIHLYNPKIGFSEKTWLYSQQKLSLYQVPLYESINSKTTTHKNIILTKKHNFTINFKYAIHIHLYYIDLAEEFCSYFSKLDGYFDLYITVVDSQKNDEIKAIFVKSPASNVYIINVENIGRDIGPFFINLKDSLTNSDYEVIGHFHSKKSLEVSHTMGDMWRRYLMENLMNNQAINIFNDKEVGLVFAEDRHSVDISTNQKYTDILCQDMKISTMKNSYIYPLGTMFWARPEALKSLFDLNYEKYLSEEPLPYDGSFLHATERLLPHICIKQNYRYVTTYQKGTSW